MKIKFGRVPKELRPALENLIKEVARQCRVISRDFEIEVGQAKQGHGVAYRSNREWKYEPGCYKIYPSLIKIWMKKIPESRKFNFVPFYRWRYWKDTCVAIVPNEIDQLIQSWSFWNFFQAKSLPIIEGFTKTLFHEIGHIKDFNKDLPKKIYEEYGKGWDYSHKWKHRPHEQRACCYADQQIQKYSPELEEAILQAGIALEEYIRRERKT